MAIIRSLLDTDFYKIKMGQFVWRRYPHVSVRFSLTNRTKSVRLAEYIRVSDLQNEFDAISELRFSAEELDFLAEIKNGDKPMFCKDYLLFLKQLRLRGHSVAENGDGQLAVNFVGDWQDVIYWEIMGLPVINELYYRDVLTHLTDRTQADVYNEGVLRLENKITLLQRFPHILFSDFGTRRRFSREWQEYVVRTLAKTLRPSQFLGTSNVYLAMKLGLNPIGTMAHELFMVFAAMQMSGSDKELVESQRRVLREWWNEYGFEQSIGLSDTWGSQFFLQKIFPEFAYTYKGMRQDSGDPFAFGEEAIRFYEMLRIDPREKMIVFSDGLDIAAMEALANIFFGRIRVSFGWGTNLTNDLGILALSLVIKVMEAAEQWAVKISDDLAKAQGRLEDVARIMRVAGYGGKFREDCKY